MGEQRLRQSAAHVLRTCYIDSIIQGPMTQIPFSNITSPTGLAPAYGYYQKAMTGPTPQRSVLSMRLKAKGANL